MQTGSYSNAREERCVVKFLELLEGFNSTDCPWQGVPGNLYQPINDPFQIDCVKFVSNVFGWHTVNAVL